MVQIYTDVNCPGTNHGPRQHLCLFLTTQTSSSLLSSSILLSLYTCIYIPNICWYYCYSHYDGQYSHTCSPAVGALGIWSSRSGDGLSCHRSSQSLIIYGMQGFSFSQNIYIYIHMYIVYNYVCVRIYIYIRQSGIVVIVLGLG